MTIRKRFGLWLLTLLLVFTACGRGQSAEAQTFDFSETAGGLPLGWTVISYENQYAADCAGGVVTLRTEIKDDVRLVKTVPVEGGKKYVLSAEIATERVLDGEGATLSIDNFSQDGSYIYSEGLFGTNGWMHVELAFETARGQSAVQLALRLGGYSSVSSGTVSFRSVTLTATDKSSANFQKLVTRSNTQTKTEDKSDDEYEAFFSLLFWLTVITAALLLYGVYRHRERLLHMPMNAGIKRLGFVLVVLVGFFIRLFLCAAFKGHATDMSCWVSWGNQIADGRFASFYDGTWYDYPPGYMLVLGGLTWVMRLLRVADWGSETLRLFWYMLPAFLCDIGCGVLLVRFAKERNLPDAAGLLLGALIVLNPAAIWLSGAWGQIDSILTLLLLLTYGTFRKGNRIGAGLWYAAAVLVKWQALIYGPVLALVYLGTLLSETNGKERLKKLGMTALTAAVALSVIFLVSLPFRGGMGLFWIVERFMKASSGYDYATVEGYNFFALLGANWHDANADLFEGAGAGWALLAALNTLGKLLLPLAVITLGAASVRDFRQKRGFAAALSLGALLLLAAVLYAIAYVVSDMEAFVWTLYGAAAALSLAAWIAQTCEGERSFASLLLGDDSIEKYALWIALLAAGVLLLTWTLWVVLHLFGVTLTYKLFGSLMIAAALGGAVWLLWRYHEAGRLTENDPELLYLVSAVFMLWVFTFGQYMHERYVFPVLLLLLFAYAHSGDRHVLLGALLLTVTTFLNETVAMYVVSDGAIHAIRGGETHNAFITVCSAAEVLSTLYLSAAVLFGTRTASDFEKPAPTETEAANKDKGGKRA
ncbi:MAG: hypothetical protein IKI59_06350 [Clostridia bacterium]|nr:hypothetical protein [Clostridia bacterium]